MLDSGKTDGCYKCSPVVIVHDAVRPFAEEEIYRKVAVAAHEHGAAGAICPLVQTVLSVSPDGLLDKALNRSLHTASHTPQAFRLDVIAAAYQKITQQELEHGTECLDLAWRYSGVKAKLIPAPDDVWKITYRKDVLTAETLAREKSILARVTCLCECPLYTEAVERAFQSKRIKYYFEANTQLDDRLFTAQVVILENGKQRDAEIQRYFHSLSSSKAKLKTLVVLLKLEMKVSGTVWEQCRDLAIRLGQAEDIAVYFILVKEGDRKATTLHSTIETTSKLLATVIFERNITMSGQVFALP